MVHSSLKDAEVQCLHFYCAVNISNTDGTRSRRTVFIGQGLKISYGFNLSVNREIIIAILLHWATFYYSWVTWWYKQASSFISYLFYTPVDNVGKSISRLFKAKLEFLHHSDKCALTHNYKCHYCIKWCMCRSYLHICLYTCEMFSALRPLVSV